MKKLLALIPAVMLLSACGGVSVGEKTTQVISYEVKVDGKVVEENKEFIYQPAQYPVKGLYDALKGKSAGSTVTVTIPPEKAYGPRKQEMVTYIVPNEPAKNLKPGDKITARAPNKEIMEGMITKVQDYMVEVDFNHPYAGKPLQYTVRVKSVMKAFEPKK